MKKQIKRKIYLLSKRETRPIEVVQYETGVQLVFEIQDIELDTAATATMFVRKPSGKFVFQEDNISLTGNTVTVDLHNQALAEYGHPFFQIKLKKEEEVISTYSGMLTVDKSLEDSGAEESKTVIAAFDTFTDEQIARIEEATQTQIDLMKAEVEAKGLSVLSSIPEDYAEMVNRVNALYNSVANAIKGFVSGSVIRVDDVSPVEHNPVVRVHGKNLLPYGTINFTKNKNCLLDKPIPPGTYVISANITSSDTDGELSSVSINSGNEVMKYITLRRNERVSSTFTVTKPITNIDFCAAYNYSQGENDTATWANIQIEEGDTATEYTPYIDPSTVTVRRCGKNLFKAVPQTINGVTLSQKDNYFVLNGTATASNNFVVTIGYLPAGKYTLSANNPTNNGVEWSLIDVYSSDPYSIIAVKDNVNNGKATAEMAESSYICRIRIESGKTYNNFVIKPQLEVGAVATDYEPYEEATEYTPSSDGTVEGFTSLPPTMTLLTDTEGVTIECEYNKDTAKVIDNLTKAVAALGGVV